MDTSIRGYIRKNLSNCNLDDIKETVISSVNSKDEVVLPGLGVLFEMIWNDSDDSMKDTIIQNLYNDIKKA